MSYPICHASVDNEIFVKYKNDYSKIIIDIKDPEYAKQVENTIQKYHYQGREILISSESLTTFYFYNFGKDVDTIKVSDELKRLSFVKSASPVNSFFSPIICLTKSSYNLKYL